MTDIDRLEAVIHARALPETLDMNFGNSGYARREDDLKFIAKARRALAGGKSIFYIAWW